jgi:uncharacterized protein (UPF0332 family)
MADFEGEVSAQLERAETSLQAAKDLLEKEQGKNLNWLFELRSVGDYGVTVHVSAGESRRAVKVAEDFILAVKQSLK